MAEYQPDAGSTKDIPYLTLTGELYGVSFVNICEKIDCVIMHHTVHVVIPKCSLDTYIIPNIPCLTTFSMGYMEYIKLMIVLGSMLDKITLNWIMMEQRKEG